MKTQLTKEESAHLISMGVPKEKASQVDWTSYSPIGIGFRYPIFTLTDLLEILPKEILIDGSYYKLIIEWSQTSALICYRNINGMLTQHFLEKELIDALYELCVWTLEQGYLKFE